MVSVRRHPVRRQVSVRARRPPAPAARSLSARRLALSARLLLLVGAVAGGLAGCSVEFDATAGSTADTTAGSTADATAGSTADATAGSTAAGGDGSAPGPTGTGPPRARATAGQDPRGNASARPGAPRTGSALQALEALPVKGRSAGTGYDRDQFGPAWRDTDRNGCDQRNDVLRRDLSGETLKPGTRGCVVLSGTLADRYTGATIAFRRSDAAEVQIDHVVALQNAWVTGASGWSEDRRERFATDPLNLLAVEGVVNQSKGSGDAATWLPPRRAFRCAYVARQVAVKATYGAWVTPAERAAIRRVLSGCPGERLPVTEPVALGEEAQEGATRDGAGPVVGAGAWCAPVGAEGVTRAGTRMTCTADPGDRPRWRAEP